MTDDSPVDRTLHRLITVALVLFLVSLGFGLKQAHCDEPLRIQLSPVGLTSQVALVQPSVPNGGGFGRFIKDEPLSFRVVLPVLVSGAALDLGSTEWALRQPGVSEGNPLGQTLNKRAALQVGFVAAETVLIRKAGRKNGKRILIGVTVIKVAVTGWNIHNSRRGQ